MRFVTVFCPRYTDAFPERHLLEDLSIEHDQQWISGKARIKSGDARCQRPPREPSESPEGYDLRARYWEAADILELDLAESKKPPNVWNYIYDRVHLPPPGVPKTVTIRRLGYMAIQRAWRRRAGKPEPDMGRPDVIEGMMLYERGQVLRLRGECARCSRGEGVSPECVILPSVCGNMCSNCLFDGAGHSCDIPDPLAVYPPRRSVADDCRATDDDRHVLHVEPVKPRKSDFVLVLKLIEQIKQSATSDAKGTDAAARAKRIEEAALQVAKAARQWGRGGSC
ncbi:hypothetical protein BX600DRAFT_467107 [Xylariales sp. PMI_506]|nr:hypothetical protein BX600DRAFT_467107 [Xylariales sp. PMI_506]